MNLRVLFLNQRVIRMLALGGIELDPLSTCNRRIRSAYAWAVADEQHQLFIGPLMTSLCNLVVKKAQVACGCDEIRAISAPTVREVQR